MKDIKQKAREMFDEKFYEGQYNSIYCKKHQIHATPYEVKNFIDKIIDIAMEAEREKILGVNCSSPTGIYYRGVQEL